MISSRFLHAHPFAREGLPFRTPVFLVRPSRVEGFLANGNVIIDGFSKTMSSHGVRLLTFVVRSAAASSMRSVCCRIPWFTFAKTRTSFPLGMTAG